MEDENRNDEFTSPDEERLIDDNVSDTDVDVEAVGTLEPDDPSTEEQTPVENEITEDSSLADGMSSVPSHDDQSHVDENCFKQISGRIEEIAGTEQRIFNEVREMHRLYHSEFAGRLKTMQDELEQYRKIDKGRAYDDILASIARIYGNNETLADEVSDTKAQKSIRYMLMDIEDLLSVYGMEKLRSVPGDKRNPRHCQVLNRVSTDDPEKHDTVAKSYNSGFYIGNRTVIKEVIDLFIYDAQASAQAVEVEEIIEAGNEPATE